MSVSEVKRRYLERTPASGRLMERAAKSMPGGSTRTLGWHVPYPLVFDHGKGVVLWDIDGNDYIDFTNNGLSLIHGHAYGPVLEALEPAMRKGTAWVSASVPQIEFAELLRARIQASGTVRFTNSGTEAAMLAVKLARRHTGRPLILKAWAGYHGSYDDLEAGLADRGEEPGRVVLADFGDLASFRAAIAKYRNELAAVILEPVMFTGVVAMPPPEFLSGVQDAAREAGVAFILDDCLMLRLAVGGSRERFGLEEPDLTVLGKFIGGGLPVGAVAGRTDLMKGLDPREPGCLYHGGSFNGNPLGMVAGSAAMAELTSPRITAMEDFAHQLRDRILKSAFARGVSLSAAGFGSVFGIYTAEEPPTPTKGRPPEAAWLELHLALINNGIYVGTEGEISLSTPFAEASLNEAIRRFDSAFDEFKSTRSAS